MLICSLSSSTSIHETLCIDCIFTSQPQTSAPKCRVDDVRTTPERNQPLQGWEPSELRRCRWDQRLLELFNALVLVLVLVLGRRMPNGLICSPSSRFIPLNRRIQLGREQLLLQHEGPTVCRAGSLSHQKGLPHSSENKDGVNNVASALWSDVTTYLYLPICASAAIS